MGRRLRLDPVPVTAVKYALFAVAATTINIAFQYLFIQAYQGPAQLYGAMAAGTIAGLVTKYVLDKRYIFNYVPARRSQEATSFLLYSFTGVFTTGIFWATELTFDALFTDESAKYVGAVIGLSIGYVLKYFLDKTYVFQRRET